MLFASTTNIVVSAAEKMTLCPLNQRLTVTLTLTLTLTLQPKKNANVYPNPISTENSVFKELKH